MEKRDKPNGCKIRVRAPYLATSERSWPQGTLAQCLERWGMECSSWFSSINVIATLTSIKCLPKMSKQNVKFQTSPLWCSFLGRCALCSLLSLITFRSSSGFSTWPEFTTHFRLQTFFQKFFWNCENGKATTLRNMGVALKYDIFACPYHHQQNDSWYPSVFARRELFQFHQTHLNERYRSLARTRPRSTLVFAVNVFIAQLAHGCPSRSVNTLLSGNWNNPVAATVKAAFRHRDLWCSVFKCCMLPVNQRQTQQSRCVRITSHGNPVIIADKSDELAGQCLTSPIISSLQEDIRTCFASSHDINKANVEKEEEEEEKKCSKIPKRCKAQKDRILGTVE